MFRGIAVVITIAILSAVGEARTGDPPARPSRIMSLNLCTDELLFRLADRADIAAVTWLARDPASSNVAELAAGLPVDHGLAEEVIALEPDLVLASAQSPRGLAALVRRAGFPLLEFDAPKSIADVRDQIGRLATALGRTERGEALVADMDRRLASLPRPAAGGALRALALDPNGFTSGAGSLMDDIVTAAGLTNVASTLGIGSYAQVPLETLVATGPDLLILDARRDGPPSWATGLLRHPVLAATSERTRTVVLPSRLWTCGGPGVVEVVEWLARAAIGRAPAAR